MQKNLIITEMRKKIGSGHLMRCLILKRNLKAFRFHLLLDSDDDPKLPFSYKKIECIRDINSLKLSVSNVDNKLIIVDHRCATNSILKRIKKLSKYLVVIDDFPHQLFSDVYLNYNFSARLVEDNIAQICLLGPKYYIMSDELVNAKKGFSRVYNDRPLNLFISLGGVDLNNISLRLTKTLAECATNYSGTLVVGKYYPYFNELKRWLSYNLPNFELQMGLNHKKMAYYIKKADYGVVSGGNILFESSYFSLPSIVFCHNYAQMINAKEYGKLTGAEFITEKSFGRLKSLLQEYAGDRKLRRKLGTRSSNLVDGKGVLRIRKILLNLVNP